MRNSTSNSFAVLAFVLGVAGCAPEDHLVASHQTSAGATGTDPGVGGTAAGGTTAVPSFGGVAAGGTTAVGGSSEPAVGGGTATTVGGSAGARATECAAYSEQASTHTIKVTVKNERSTPVYVGSRVSRCFEDDGLRVFDAQGNELSIDRGGVCSCDELMELGYCMVNSCSRSSLRLMEPGTSIELSWNGRHTLTRELPLACQKSESENTYCIQHVPAVPGTYRLAVTGSTEYQCALGLDPAYCDCMATNSCEPYSVPVEGAGKLLEPSATVDLAAGTATVVFSEDLGT